MQVVPGKTIIGASSTQSSAASLREEHPVPFIPIRETRCVDGATVRTIKRGMVYESLDHLPDGGTGTQRLTQDYTRMMIDHDSLVHEHGGKV